MQIRLRLLLLLCCAVIGTAPAASQAAVVEPIVGGTVAPPGAWPWAADVDILLQVGSSLSGFPTEASCGGSVIGARWVLTAAHCLDFSDVSDVRITGVRVRVGASDLSAPGGTTLTADAFFANPTFASATFQRDFGLIRLPSPVDVRAVALPTVGDAPLWAPGVVATVIGWGALVEGGTFDSKLRQVEVPIIPAATCGSPEQYGAAFDPQSMMCAGYAEGGRDSCFGDSGGPLLVPDGDGGWVQAGITSWGDGCARPNKPGVYASVGALMPSILRLLTTDPVAPVSPPTGATGDASDVNAFGADVGGSVTPGGLGTTYRVDYGTTRSYGSSVSGYAGAGGEAVQIAAELSDLDPKTVIHYQVVATSGAGTSVGQDQVFTTTALALLGKATLRRGTIRVPVTCRAGQKGPCRGPLRLTANAGGSPVVVGRTAVSAGSGSPVSAQLALNRVGRKLLANRGRLAVKATFQASAGGVTAIITSTSVLR